MLRFDPLGFPDEENDLSDINSTSDARRQRAFEAREKRLRVDYEFDRSQFEVEERLRPRFFDGTDRAEEEIPLHVLEDFQRAISKEERNEIRKLAIAEERSDAEAELEEIEKALTSAPSRTTPLLPLAAGVIGWLTSTTMLGDPSWIAHLTLIGKVLGVTIATTAVLMVFTSILFSLIVVTVSSFKLRGATGGKHKRMYELMVSSDLSAEEAIDVIATQATRTRIRAGKRYLLRQTNNVKNAVASALCALILFTALFALKSATSYVAPDNAKPESPPKQSAPVQPKSSSVSKPSRNTEKRDQ